MNDALRNGFDVDRRFNLNLLRMLNVRYLLSQYPLQGSGLKLVHAADPWPTWPEYRDRNTGLVVGERHPPEMTIQHSLRWLQPFWDYFQFNRRKLQGKDVFVYELAGSMERFRLIHNLEIKANGKAVLDRLSSMDLAALSSTAVLESRDAAEIKYLRGLAGGTVKVIVYDPDNIELEVFTSGDAFLVMASTWSPYWTAEVDRRMVPLIRTNHAQYGLQLGAGTHTIKLAYRPPYALGL